MHSGANDSNLEVERTEEIIGPKGEEGNEDRAGERKVYT